MIPVHLRAVPSPSDEGLGDFGRAMLAGLAARPRAISPKFFYDAAGSALFDQICTLPEYYPTRTEIGILDRHAGEIAACVGEGAEIVEFGAGSVLKIRRLLDALERPARFLPIDISGEHLHAAADALRADYPTLAIEPVVADFTKPLALPKPLGGGRRFGFFPGSSIGNFTPEEAVRFLRQAAVLLRGGGMLIGVDLVKDPQRLHAAYNDAAGVTAAFNRNLLARANRELGADFDPGAFAHYAFFNPQASRIEMHLISSRRQCVTVAGQCFDFEEGEHIHTENSYKFTVDAFRRLATLAGFKPGPVWCDEARWFSLHWLAAPGG
jgi:dimethylhistidine N-methyltransferase